MKKFKIALISLGLIAGFAGATGLMVPQYAHADASDEIQKGVNKAGGTGAGKVDTKIQDIVNVLLFVLGAIAVIMIVIGGIRYAVSGGDSGAVKGAKDTILYAVVGLVVAMLAYAIVNFVVGAF